MSPQASDGPEVWWVEVEERLFGHRAFARSSQGRCIQTLAGPVGCWGLTERGAARRMRRCVIRTLRRKQRALERESNASVYPIEL